MKHLKYAFSIFLALMLAVGILAPAASALNPGQPHEVSWDHRLLDENGNSFTWHTGLAAEHNPWRPRISSSRTRWSSF